MSKSCDLLLDGKHEIHLSIIPSLGLIIINDLADFGENWLEVKVVENNRYNLQYDISMLTGVQTDNALQAVARYFIDVLHNNLHKKAGPMPEQMGFLLKFVLNINLKPEILNNRNYIKSLGDALGDLVGSCR